MSERRVWKRKLNPVCFQGAAAAAVAQASADLWGAFKKGVRVGRLLKTETPLATKGLLELINAAAKLVCYLSS